MPRTSWGHLKTFEFLSPPLPEQRAIAAVLDSIDDAIERAEAVIAATGQLRDSLLHQLLTRGVPGRHMEWKLDFTQNLEEAMDAIALARRRLRLASEGFSLSAADPDIQEPPVARYHPLADSLACAA